MYTYTGTNIDTNTENNQMRLTKIYANKYNCIKFLIQTSTQLQIHSYSAEGQFWTRGKYWTEKIGYKEVNFGYKIRHNIFIENAVKCYGYFDIQNLIPYIQFAPSNICPVSNIAPRRCN